MSKKDAEQVRRALVKHLRKTESDLQVVSRGSHWHVVTPDGHSVYNFATTPSKDTFVRNTTADLRRLGIVPKDWRP